MQSVFAEAVRLLKAGERFALATVVDTNGSTPQKPGAKLLVRADGTTVGTLGGGCVEAEVWQEAAITLRDGGRCSLREFSLSDDLAAESGMVCGGVMTVFVEVVANVAIVLPLAEAVERALAGGEAVAVATVVAASQPDRLGARLLLERDNPVGSLGEVSWDEAAIEVCRSLRARGGTRLIEVAVGTRVFAEGFLAPDSLLLVGAGHIARALCPLAKHLGFRVVVLDDRADFANEERFPGADEVIAADIAATLRCYPVSASTSIVIATRGHQKDVVALREAVRSTAGYIGMVGSRRKVRLVLRQLLEEGLRPERLDSVRSPVGLDIGARSPEEIALSILAEVVMIRSGGGTGRPLKLNKRRLFETGEKARPAVAG